jgi:four helix bundle protein
VGLSAIVKRKTGKPLVKDKTITIMNALPVQSFKKLTLYQKSKELVLFVYKITNKYPKSETYTLIPQMKRSAVSILANIVEGYIKDYPAEYARFLTISIGSLAELEVYVDLSYDLGFLDKPNLDRMYLLLGDVKKLLYGSRKAVRRKILNKR